MKEKLVIMTLIFMSIICINMSNESYADTLTPTELNSYVNKPLNTNNSNLMTRVNRVINNNLSTMQNPNFVYTINKNGEYFYFETMGVFKVKYVNGESILYSTGSLTGNLITASTNWLNSVAGNDICNLGEGLNQSKVLYYNNSITHETLGVFPLNESIYIQQIGEQYALISSPPDDYKTVSKTINYLMNYRIKANSANDIVVHIKGIDGLPLTQNNKALSYGIRSHTGKQIGLYYEGTLNIFVNYVPEYIGKEGIIVSVESVANKTFVSDLKNIEIVSFIDSNADGKNDLTEENAYIPPKEPGAGIIPDNLDRTAYSNDIWGELQYLGDKLISFITLPFKFVIDSLTFVTQWANDSLSWINQISMFFSTFLGFLPMEIITAIQMLVYVFVIFGIIKLMRG